MGRTSNGGETAEGAVRKEGSFSSSLQNGFDGCKAGSLKGERTCSGEKVPLKDKWTPGEKVDEQDT